MTEDAKGYHFKFRKAIFLHSDEKKDFKKACKEWSHTDYIHKEHTNCICSNDIYDCFTIKHYSGKVLEPIGKDCIKHIADNNEEMKVSLKKAIKFKNNIKNMKEGNPYCNICYSTVIVEMFYTKDNENFYNMPYVFCKKCSNVIDIQKKYKNVVIKTINLYRKLRIKLKIKKPIMNIIKPLNEAIAKEKLIEMKRKQIIDTEYLGSKVLKFGMFANKRYENVVNEKRFKSWFKFMLTKQDFLNNSLNTDLINYCKNRLN